MYSRVLFLKQMDKPYLYLLDIKFDVTDPDLMVRVLELAIKESDTQFVRYLITEQGVVVKGKPLVYMKVMCSRVLLLE